MLLNTVICCSLDTPHWAYYPMFESQFRHTIDKSPAVTDMQLDIQLKN